jgi:nitrile hydratase
LGSAYFQLWLLRTEALLKEKGILTDEQIKERMAQLSPNSIPKPHLEAFRKVKPLIASSTRRVLVDTTSGATSRNEDVKPKFQPGTMVKAKAMAPLGHTRIPRYVRGKVGMVDAIHGLFTLPDAKVHEGIDLYQTVYRVRFIAQDLWGEDASPKDKLYIELWEDYLELAEA